MSSTSTNKTVCSKTSRDRSKHGAHVVAQTTIDAKLHVDFEGSERFFDYSASVDINAACSTSNVHASTVQSYLQNIQRASLVQPFGCMIAVDGENLSVLAYSENAPEMLDLAPHAVPNIEQQEALTFGTDVRTLFRSPGAAALQKAADFKEVNLLNPILVHCKTSGKPFYAILHRVDVGLIIDLEPVNPADVPVTAAGALKSYKLASKAISKLQSLPSGNISLLCEVLVKEVSDLTGYDRVMVYKFHDDEHGEVVAECCRSDLEPYLGLHYPATDIPQASRFLFLKNKVRMICDCLAPPVKVLQDRRLTRPLSLCGSALRAPHGCHAQYMMNMGSIASLVMSITINENDSESENDQEKDRKLWGLVVCHHTSPRFVPFPLRYACEFLIQVFGIQINKEVELQVQLKEKHILRIQTVLCDMLLRDAPVGIVTQSPNIMDLVKCDGAALYFRKKFWLLGVTPTEAQIRNIAEWLLKDHGGSTGLNTDSLIEAGFYGASALGDEVCGMAAVRITSKDFLFWFRSHMAKEIRWGGAKHDPGDEDDGRKMHPRSSFKAFLEVVKRRSQPWEDVEMDAIHSLQLILRGSLQDEIEEECKVITNIPPPPVDEKTQQLDELRVITNEMIRLIETAAVPILAVDVFGKINGWNSKATELTGLAIQQAIGMPLVDCLVNDSVKVVKKMLSLAIQGIEEKNIEIKLKTFGIPAQNGPVILEVNSCCSRDLNNNVVGISFIGQDVTKQKLVMNQYIQIQGDYMGIMRNPSALIPPIFMTDSDGRCLEWNDAMEKLSGFRRVEMTNRMLLGEVFTLENFGCSVKDHTLTNLRIILHRVISGQDAEKSLFRFRDREGNYVETLLTASRRTDAEGNITGVFFFLHVASPELQYALEMQRISEQATAENLHKLAYLRQEIQKPLDGIAFMQNLMGSSDLSKEQMRLLKLNTSSWEQLHKIVHDTDIQSIEECYMETNCSDFNLGDVLDVVTNQNMILSQERGVKIICESPTEVSSLHLYGDNMRLQQVLSEFLTNTLLFSCKESSVVFKATPRKERIGKGIHIVHLELRITHPAPGIPVHLIREMFDDNIDSSKEGLGLYISQKLVKIMNGTVQYLREAATSSFLILIEFPLVEHIAR